MNRVKYTLLTASIGFALAFAISCSSDDNDNGPSSSVSSSSIGGVSSSSNVSSSSVGDISSSSSELEAIFYLTTKETEFLVTSGKKTLYFYAEYVPDQAITVNLIDSDGNIVAEMKDDAKYSISGDDIQGDGVFSAKLEINLSVAGTFTYRAVAQVGSEKTVSNEVTIYIFSPLTPQDIEKMAIVDSKISTLIESYEYSKMNLKQRSDAFLSLFTELSEQGLIIKDSITYIEGSDTITFKYSSGVTGIIMLKGWSSD